VLGHVGQHRRDPLGDAGPQRGLGRGLRGLRVLALHRREQRMRPGHLGDAGRHRALPQRQRPHRQVGGFGQVGGLGRALGQRAELQQVQPGLVDHETVTAGAADQQVTGGPGGQAGVDQPAQQADVPLDDVDRAVGRVLTPQRADQFADHHRLTRADQQYRQQGAPGR
jgi:hypothetical protein